jgi:Tfp pilus assembly protein PilX
MVSTFKIFNYRQKSEKGFILIAAIMAVMIMLAVSFFILTTATQDIRMSSRLVGERKALSAAEAGVQAIYANSSSIAALTATNNVNVDSTNDPATSYSYTTPTNTNAQTSLAGGCEGCVSYIWGIDVTGVDSNYGSSVTINIGIAPPPTPGSPIYENPISGP